MDPYIIIFIVSILPWIELRGAIPLGILVYGLDPMTVFVVSAVGNALAILPIYVGLSYCYDYFKRYKLVERIVSRAREKAGPIVDKYGIPGLAMFVAIPLPLTGAWTGTLVAWLFGMERKKAGLAILAGVIAAGVIVLLLSLFAAEVLYALGVPRP